MPSTFGRVRRANAPENATTTIPAGHRCSVDATNETPLPPGNVSGRWPGSESDASLLHRGAIQPDGLVQIIAANLQTVMTNPGSKPWFGSSA
jgi:hypothetical protein